jgi:hypothetical protein
MNNLFSGDSIWAGGFYELAMELGPRSNERLDAALKALWGHEALFGCYVHSNSEPSAQERIIPDLRTLEIHGHLLGLATLPEGGRVACGTFAVREEGRAEHSWPGLDEGSTARGGEGIDWLVLYLPMGALSTVREEVAGFPFGSKETRVWQEPLDEWLARIGRSVFAQVIFRLGLVGFEASGEACAADVAACGIPTERWFGYFWPEDGTLCWHPANVWTPPFSFSK